MYNDGQYTNKKNFNEDLGLFLPNSIIPDIMNESELNSSKNLYKIVFGNNDGNENSEIMSVVIFILKFRRSKF